MIENIYKNVDFIDGNLKRVILEALDRSFRMTRGKIPISYKDETIGYCDKYICNKNNIDLHTMINDTDYSNKKVGFNLVKPTLTKENKIVKAEIYDIILY